MLKEEKELRAYLDQRLMEDEYQNATTQLTALVRAVREDERKRCKLDVPHPPKVAGRKPK